MLGHRCARVSIASVLIICGMSAQTVREIPSSVRALPVSVSVESSQQTRVVQQSAAQRVSSQLRRRVLPPPSANLSQLAKVAGIIFSGTVTGITPHEPTAAAGVQTIAVTFHVEKAIRGVTVGQDLTISQWMGLWYSGQRYAIGEHVLLFLYAPSKLGLTSCVGGPIGRFTVDSSGEVFLSSGQLPLFLKDPALGGRSRVPLSDFASAVRQAREEEWKR